MLRRTLTLLAVIALTLAGSARPGLAGPPQGLGQPQGLGGPGGLAKIDPKALAFEADLHRGINALRSNKKLPGLTLEPRLRAFARREAELAAHGDPSAGGIDARIQKQGIAPYGHFMQMVFAKDAPRALKGMLSDKGMAAALVDDYAKVGVGAFWVPVDDPYYQILVILTKVPDPMAGKPGLSKAQTDPVMDAALPGIQGCYNKALDKNPNLEGTVIFKIVIGGEGTVSDVGLIASIGDEAFGGCALLLLRGLQFPKPYKGKPVTLNHPVRLAPPHGGRRVGKLTEQQIAATFSRARYDFKRCYEERLAQRPDLAGSLALAMTVQPSGAVTKVRIGDDSLKDPALSRCILDRAKELHFPRPKFDGEVEVSYPLGFTPPAKGD